MLCGFQLWILSIRAWWEGGVWKNIRKGWVDFFRFVRLKWVIGLRSTFCMTCSVRMRLWGQPSRSCLVFLAVRRLRWNVTFITSVHDWEVVLISFFFYILYSLKLRAGGDKKIYWIRSKRLMCEVRSQKMCLVPPLERSVWSRCSLKFGGWFLCIWRIQRNLMFKTLKIVRGQ